MTCMSKAPSTSITESIPDWWRHRCHICRYLKFASLEGPSCSASSSWSWFGQLLLMVSACFSFIDSPLTFWNVILLDMVDDTFVDCLGPFCPICRQREHQEARMTSAAWCSENGPLHGWHLSRMAARCTSLANPVELFGILSYGPTIALSCEVWVFHSILSQWGHFYQNFVAGIRLISSKRREPFLKHHQSVSPSNCWPGWPKWLSSEDSWCNWTVRPDFSYGSLL